MVKSTLLFLASLSSRFRLQFIWTPFYFLSASIARLIFLKTGCEVWTRNSYRLGYANMPSSDLDISVMMGIHSINIQKIRSKLNLVKAICPLIREVNLYSASDLDFILDHINPCELERDPQLKQILKSKRSKSDAQRLVFIFKNFTVDLDNLSCRPLTRNKRWINLLKIADCTPSAKDILSSIKKGLSTLSDTNNVECYFEGALQHRSFQLPDSLWYLDPVAYIIRSLNTHHEIVVPKGDLTPFQKNVLIEVIRWEIWGLSTQIYLCDDFSGFKDHLVNLEKLYSTKLPSEDLYNLEKSIKQFFFIMERYDR